MPIKKILSGYFHLQKTKGMFGLKRIPYLKEKK